MGHCREQACENTACMTRCHMTKHVFRSKHPNKMSKHGTLRAIRSVTTCSLPYLSISCFFVSHANRPLNASLRFLRIRCIRHEFVQFSFDCRKSSYKAVRPPFFPFTFIASVITSTGTFCILGVLPSLSAWMLLQNLMHRARGLLFFLEDLRWPELLD